VHHGPMAANDVTEPAVQALIAYADENGFVRVVLSPTERSIPLYERTGFGPADALMLRTPPPWQPSIV
jgi:hypothetical protein